MMLMRIGVLMMVIAIMFAHDGDADDAYDYDDHYDDYGDAGFYW